MRFLHLLLFMFTITYFDCSTKISIEKSNFVKKRWNDEKKTIVPEDMKSFIASGLPDWCSVKFYKNDDLNNITITALEQYKLIIKLINGPNICETEANYIEESPVDCDDFLGDYVGRLGNYYLDAYVGRIKVRTANESLTNVTARILGCCAGFTTNNIFEFGCDKEINESLISSYNISLSQEEMKGSTIFYETSGKKFYSLPGIRDIYGFPDKQVFLTETNETFVLRHFRQARENRLYPQIHLNCAVNNKTLRTNDSMIHLFEGSLDSAYANTLDIIETNPQLSMFYNLLGDKIRTLLREANKSTVFAFTNEAFGKLPESTMKHMLNEEMDQCVMEAMKRHFTTEESYCDSDLESDFRSQNDNIMEIQKTPTLKIGNARIVNASLFAMNGVVHIVDEVLFDDNYLSWKQGVRKFNPRLADALEQENFGGDVIVLIPPKDTQINNPKNYVISKDKFFGNFIKSRVMTNAGSKLPTASNFDSTYYQIPENSEMNSLAMRFGQIGCSRFTAKPIKSCKSELYLIDKPLPLVTQSIDEYLAAREDLSIFYGLWKDCKKCWDSQIFIKTVFVPPNDVFSPLLMKEIGTSLKSIESFVKGHTSRDYLCSFDFEEAQEYSSYESVGDHVLIPTFENGVAKINGTRIQELEIILSDGLIHIIESPIISQKN